MKDFLSVNSIFVPGASGVGTITLAIPDFDVKKLVSVINQTKGEIIYSTGSTTLRYTSLVGNRLTLNYDTTTHSPNDVIQVIYNDSNPLSIALDNISVMFRAILKAIQYPNYVDRSANAVRANVLNSLTVGTLPTLAAVTNVATVAAVTNVANIGNYNGEILARSISRSAWYNSVRPRIT